MALCPGAPLVDHDPMSRATGDIVIGYDGSADSELALDWAGQLAAEQGRRLRVLISEVERTQVLEVTADWHAERMARLEEDARARVAEGRAGEAEVEIVSEPPTEALVKASAAAATVVLGARGHGRVAGVLLGSVSQQVVRDASCPVVVVRPQQQPEATRVVVGVDGSPHGEKALDFALEHASLSGSPLTAIHGYRQGVVRRETQQEVVVDREEAERLLGEALAGFSERYPDVRVTAEAIPVPAHQALTDASATAALVVVGSRGRSAIAALALGSVSQSVLHRARCPVAVVR